VEPTAGTLGPGEAAAVTWTFVPASQQQHQGRVACSFAPAVGPRGALPHTLAEDSDGLSSPPAMTAVAKVANRSVRVWHGATETGP
jgi:hypothetical protein